MELINLLACSPYRYYVICTSDDSSDDSDAQSDANGYELHQGLHLQAAALASLDEAGKCGLKLLQVFRFGRRSALGK